MAWIDVDSDYFNNLTLDEDGEARLALLLDSAQAAVEKHLGRVIAETEHDEVLTVQQDGVLFLGNFPIVSVARLLTKQVKTMTLQNTDATHASYSVSGESLKLVSMANGGRVDRNILFTSAATIESVAQAVIDLDEGWDALIYTGYEDYPSSDLVRQFATATDEVDVYSWDQSNVHLVIDHDIGMVSTSLPAGSEVRVIYTAGFDPVPADLQGVLADLVIEAVDQTIGGKTQETIGEYSYTLGNMSERIQRLGVTNKTILAQYRDRRA